MRRRNFNVAAFASLVLLLAGIVVWVRSYPNWDVFAHRGNLLIVLLEADDGAGYLRLQRQPDETSVERAERFWRLAHEVTRDNTDGARTWRGGMGFGMGRAYVFYAIDNNPRRGLSGWFTLLSVPMWFIVMCLAGPPALWVLGWRRRRRRAIRGLCAGCGYDIRATPERCPECGAVPAAPQTAA